MDLVFEQEARSGLENAGNRVWVRVNESVKKTREAIQRRLLTAVGVATAASVVVGIVPGVAPVKKTNVRKKRDTGGEN